MSAALGASLGVSDGCTSPAGISFLKHPGSIHVEACLMLDVSWEVLKLFLDRYDRNTSGSTHHGRHIDDVELP